MAISVDVKKVVTQHLEESIKKSLEEALKTGEIKVEEAARRWAIHYCEFAGLTPEEAEKVVKERKVLEVCAERVAKAYAEYL